MDGGLSVILPALNEEAIVGETVLEALEVLSPHVADLEVIVVDDGSSDSTAGRVAALQQRDPRVVHVRHELTRGYGAALRSGFERANKRWVFWTDADGQLSFEDLVRWAPLRGPRTVLAGYRSPRADPFARVWLGEAWSALTNTAFGYVARDVDCAFKLLPRSAFEGISLHSEGPALSAELLIKLRGAGFRLLEVPVSHRPRRSGGSTMVRPGVMAQALVDVARVKWFDR